MKAPTRYRFVKRIDAPIDRILENTFIIYNLRKYTACAIHTKIVTLTLGIAGVNIVSNKNKT